MQDKMYDHSCMSYIVHTTAALIMGVVCHIVRYAEHQIFRVL